MNVRQTIQTMRSLYDNVEVGSAGALLLTTGAVLTTPGQDTVGYNTACLRVLVGPSYSTQSLPGGTPVASLSVVLQESSDNSTWATANDNTGAAIGGTVNIITTPAVMSVNSYRIEGLNLNRKRYLRAQITPTFSLYPSLLNVSTCAAVIELGRASENPVPETPATSNT